MNTESGGPIEIRISKWSSGLGARSWVGPLTVPEERRLFRGYELRRRGNQA
jgi:hypothetical protein